MTSRPYLVALMITLSWLAVAQSQEDDPEECLGDRKPNIGMSDANSDYVLHVDESTADGQAECEEMCCNYASECNVAVFERKNKHYYCSLLYCNPLEKCEWDPNPSSSVTELKVAAKSDAQLHLEEDMQKQEDNFEDLVNGKEPSDEGTTDNITALIEEVDQEVDSEFKDLFANETWRINTDATAVADDSSPTPVTSQADDDATDKPWDGSWDDWIDEADGHDVNDEDDDITSGAASPDDSTTPNHTGSDDSSADTSPAAGSGRPAHSNNGVWGPNNVNDIDYDDNATPFIILGVIASIVFILMVLIFVAKKLSVESERLQYRPLNESFPSSTPYHDNKGQYHDIE